MSARRSHLLVLALSGGLLLPGGITSAAAALPVNAPDALTSARPPAAMGGQTTVAPTSTAVKIEIGSVIDAQTPLATVMWSAVRGDFALKNWEYDVMWAKGTTDDEGKVTFGPEEKYPMSNAMHRAVGVHRGLGDIHRFTVTGRDPLTGEKARGEHIVHMTNIMDLPSATGKASPGWHLVKHPEYFGGTAAVTYRPGETITQVVTTAVDATLTVKGTLVPQGGTAEISVDGGPATSFTTSTGTTTSKYPYRQPLTTVPLPAGKHVVTIKSSSAGTLALDSLNVTPRHGQDRMGSVDVLSTGELNYEEPTQKVSWDVSHGPLDTRYRVTFAEVKINPDGSRSYGPEKLWFADTSKTEATFRGEFGDKYEVRVSALWPDGRNSAVSTTTVRLAPAPIDITGVGADKNWHFVQHPSYLNGTALVTYQDKARWTTTETFDGQGYLVFRGTTLPQGAKATVYVDGTSYAELDTAGPVKYQEVLGNIVCDHGKHTITVEAHTSPGHHVLALDAYQIADGKTFRP
ncbi:hypothetical protein [Austwickia chelonae]|uniref:hypothetical protein n=1 Tax=Austwickia chelonae TaxID=100225 RepID=UPI000E239FBD|nr:hypothetical protein [Austwickia chelonae]